MPTADNPGWPALLAAFEACACTEILPLCDSDVCAVRRVIDAAAAEVLGVPEDTADEWRRRLAAEPTVTGRPASRKR